MSQTVMVAAPACVSASKTIDRRSASDRRFYIIAAAVMLLFTAAGFRNFLLHGKAVDGNITAQIVPLVVIHGIAMMGWVIVFLVQCALIQSGRRKLHLAIGPFGALLGMAIVILGPIVAMLSVHFNPATYQNLGGPKFFLAVMFMQMLAFGTFVRLGWFYRRKPGIHRPMMLLATLVIQSGSLSRTPYIWNLSKPPLYVQTPVLVFGALLFFLQWAMARTPNRVYLMGYAGLFAATLLSVGVGHSAFWDHMASALTP